MDPKTGIHEPTVIIPIGMDCRCFKDHSIKLYLAQKWLHGEITQTLSDMKEHLSRDTDNE